MEKLAVSQTEITSMHPWITCTATDPERTVRLEVLLLLLTPPFPSPPPPPICLHSRCYFNATSAVSLLRWDRNKKVWVRRDNSQWNGVIERAKPHRSALFKEKKTACKWTPCHLSPATALLQRKYQHEQKRYLATVSHKQWFSLTFIVIGSCSGVGSRERSSQRWPDEEIEIGGSINPANEIYQIFIYFFFLF